MLRASHGLVLSVLGLLVLATVMVNSASLSLSGDGPTTSGAIFWGKHTWFAVGALVAFGLGALVPVDRFARTGGSWWRTPAAWVAGGVLVALALVHVPGVGREANGALRWISIGPVGLQPSEVAKWGIPVVLAWYAVRYRARLGTFTWGYLVPLGAVSAVCAAIAMEDLGTAVLIELVALAVLLAAGARWRFVAVSLPVGILAFAGLVIASPYRVKRIVAFLDPYQDPRGIGYHIIQSMEAISGGGLAGRGLGNSELKFGYLPEATTDFIYAIVAEELGLTGAALVIGLYVLLIACGIAVVTAVARGRGSSLLSPFAQLLGFGIVLTVGVQALINVCVVTGLAPTKGIALPLMSRGGTGWILTCLSIGLLVSMERASDRRRRELGEPVPGEEPTRDQSLTGSAAGAA